MSGATLTARILTCALAAVTGAAVGFVLTFTHRQYVADVLGLDVPLGLVGGLAIVAALLAGLRLALEERLAPLAAGIGVVGASAALAVPTASGSVLVLDDPVGYAWAIGPALLALVAVGWPDRRRRAVRSA